MRGILKGKNYGDIILFSVLTIPLIFIVCWCIDLSFPKEIEIKVKDITWEHIVKTQKYMEVNKEDWYANIPTTGVEITKIDVIAHEDGELAAWCSYKENEWIMGKTYYTYGKKGDLEEWPEVTQISYAYKNTLGDVREFSKEEKFFITTDKDIRYEVSRAVYDDALVGSKMRVQLNQIKNYLDYKG